MGIFSIILALLAWLGSAVWLWLTAGWLFGVIEIALVAGGLLAASFLYCTHCPLHRKGCMHGFIGLPARLLRDRCHEPYTTTQTLVMLTAVAAGVVFPQYWLLRNLVIFAAFWILFGTAGVLILRFVCPACANANCAVKKLLTGN
jgi:hypothetical protein